MNLDSDYASRSLAKELCAHLEEVQGCFIKLLADPKSKHMSRESCCLGLAACRSLADAAPAGKAGDFDSYTMNDRLLRAFGQTTRYEGSAMQETSAQASDRRRAEGRESTDREGGVDDSVEGESGGVSGMSEAALGAYREMASAAVSLGRPDVLYALLILSVSHPSWFSPEGRERYSPSALLGKHSIIGSHTNTTELRVALRPHLGKLLPRMLRACYDPNKQTREQMVRGLYLEM